MNFDNYSNTSQLSLQEAQKMAVEYKHDAIEIEHLALGVLIKDLQVIPYIFKKMAVEIPPFKEFLQHRIINIGGSGNSSPYLARTTADTLQQATVEAKKNGDDFVTTEHILLALIDGKNQVAEYLKSKKVTKHKIKEAMENLRKGSKANSANAENKFDALNKYATNLNELAASGKLDPVIGRDEEIRRVLHILARRTKNNPILIGEPGVGKTAIIEGLAHRIIEGDIPQDLTDKEIYALDMGSLLAGAKFQGEFEERLKAVIDEVVKADGDIFLFIDEIHTLVGAGKTGGAMDAANILKPALARGLLRTIGATTLDEYQKYFENDKALVRRFQTVFVGEPSNEDAISILRGLKERYETHHKINIKDSAIVAAVQLSSRYIAERKLPDKAIDLIDEAAAKLRLEMNSVPADLDETERKILQLEIEKEAVKREDDKARMKQIDVEIQGLQITRDEMRTRWENDRSLLMNIQQTKENIEHSKSMVSKAEREGDFSTAAELKYGKIPKLENQINILNDELKRKQEDGSLVLKEEVTVEDIADIVSRWTGIPVSKLQLSEREKLINLEKYLHKRVIGQEEAARTVADAIRRSRTGMGDETKPIGSFLFLGTTGVGKTELAKTLADFLFDDESMLTRIDMSEYQEKHTVSRLVGAPPGYVGYDEGGQLTEAVRRKPFSVVLLDEIEKAHPDIFNILLQVLDDGRLTDSKGRIVDFKNTIIIMTSNLGANIIQDNFENINEQNRLVVQEKVKNEMFIYLKSQLRPEFLNRIDELVVFEPLSHKHLKGIIKIQLNLVKEKLKLQHIDLDFSKPFIGYLAELGHSFEFGARPLKRLIQKELVNEISNQILRLKIVPHQHYIVDVFDGKIVFREPIKSEKV